MSAPHRFLCLCVHCRLYTLIRCPSNRHLTHCFCVNMHGRLYSAEHTHTYFLRATQPLCFSAFLIRLLHFRLCRHLLACLSFSVFSLPCHPRLPPLFLCITLSPHWCMMQWNKMWQSTFSPLLYSRQTRLSPLRFFPPFPHPLILCLFLVLSSSIALLLLSISPPPPPPPSSSFSPHLSSSRSSFRSLESSSFRLFH